MPRPATCQAHRRPRPPLHLTTGEERALHTCLLGVRSAERQRQLDDEAIATDGSPERAHEWVLPPDES